MADVFISYAREDASEAERLASALEACGFSCWWDRNLTSGSRYLEETDAQLKASKAVVVIWSSVSVRSHWVADEAGVGRDEGRLAALSFDGSQPPLGFRQFQVTDFAGWQGDAAAAPFRNLLAALERLAPRGGPAAAPALAPVVATRGNLPRRLEPLIGREAELAQIASLLKEAPLVTLTGPGGIGKTRLAIEAAQRAAGEHPDGAFLVELAGVSDPAGIPIAIARALGIEVRDGADLNLIQALSLWQALIVLDNCEHLVEAAAQLIEAILQKAPRLRVLATSQEMLGLEGERVVRLRSLGSEDAVELFMRAARSADAEFVAEPAERALIGRICTRLDGVALAIEMAAGHAPVLGCAALLAALDDRFRLLTVGRRTALPRQRTLQATLDWSHSLLTSAEAAVFRRLAVFADNCTMEAARAVASDGQMDGLAVSNALAALTRKSLAVMDRGGAIPRYRLLETMRAYAQARLLEAGETQTLQRRLAEHLAQVFAPCQRDYFLGSAGDREFHDQYVSHCANLERSLDWAFGDDGDRDLGVRLVATSMPIFIFQARHAELLGWTERAQTEADGALIDVGSRIRAGGALATAFLSPGQPQDDGLIDDGDLDVRVIAIAVAGIEAGLSGSVGRIKPLRDRLDAADAPPDSRIRQWLDVCEILGLDDTSRRVAAADHIIARASATAREEGALFSWAYGSSQTPWATDPDVAIDTARAILARIRQRERFQSNLFGLSELAVSFVASLCLRGRPTDIAEARAETISLIRRFVVPPVSVTAALGWLAFVDGRPADAARILGKIDKWRFVRTPFRAAALGELLAQVLSAETLQTLWETAPEPTMLEAIRLGLGEDFGGTDQTNWRPT